jgi:hypothetical protein
MFYILLMKLLQQCFINPLNMLKFTLFDEIRNTTNAQS